jgi:hypothetical protein
MHSKAHTEAQRRISRAITDLRERWDLVSPHVHALVRLSELLDRRRLATTADQELDTRDLRKLKLLYSLFDGERVAKLLHALSSYEPNTRLEDEDIEALSPTELRLRLFDAIESGKEREAFLLCGRLNRADHDDGEVQYLFARCYFSSNAYEKAISHAAKIPPGAIDYSKGLLLQIEANAMLGRVEPTLRLIQQRGLSSFTATQYLHVLQVLCSNAEGLESVPPEDLITEEMVSKLEVLDPDPAYTKFAEYHCQLATELLVQLREWVGYSRLQEQPTADLQSLLFKSANQNLRLYQVVSALMMTGQLGPYLAEVEAGGSGVATLFRVAQAGQQGSHKLMALMFQALFELDEHARLIAIFSTLVDKIERIDSPVSSQILNLAYQSALVLGRPLATSIRHKLEARGALKPDAEQAAHSARVAASLTDMGRKAYESASMVLASLGDERSTWKDAGLVSLGFFRIIEYELNARFLGPSLTRLERAELQRLHKALPGKKRGEWAFVVNGLDKVFDGKAHGLMLGELEAWLGRIGRAPDSPEEAPIRDLLRQALLPSLTPEGLRALDAGQMGALIAQGPRERYRNPPAHTRFVPLKVAHDCKAYVDRALEQLSTWHLKY